MKPHRVYLLVAMLVHIISLSLLSQHYRDQYYKRGVLDAGNVKTYLNNLGNLGYPRTYAGGAFWEIGESFPAIIVYDHGLNIVGKVNDTVKALMNFWQSPFSPGPIIDGIPAIYSPEGDTSRYRPYRITRYDDASKNPDLKNWPEDLGAPVDSLGRPRFYGDQTVWMVYNGADTGAMTWASQGEVHRSTLPLEMRQCLYSYKKDARNSTSFIYDVVFMEWEIINRSAVVIDSAYIGFWTDIDFNGGYENYPGVDTTLQLGYCWGPRDSINIEHNPITVGYVLLYGPHVPAQGEQAVFKERILNDQKNLPITSFLGIIDDEYQDSLRYSFPHSIDDAWNVACGLTHRCRPLMDPTTGMITRFTYPGDPVTNQGWIYPGSFTGREAGFLFYSGPVTFAPNDTQWIMIALLPTLGTDNLQSIQQLRSKTGILRKLSVDYFRGDGSDWEDIGPVDVPTFFELYQNYPNPFNSNTTIAYDIAFDAKVEISVYNILGQKIKTLVNEQKPAGQYTVAFGSDGLASGIYICRMQIDNSAFNRKMVVLK